MPTRLSDLALSKGHRLPTVKQGLTSFVLYRILNGVTHISGQIAQFEGERPYIGRLGDEFTTEQGIEAAKLCALNILAWLAKAVDDDSDRIDFCLRLGGYVACTHDYKEQSQVISGASNLVVDILGERGRHTRTAIGVSALPFGVSVDIDAQFALKV